MNTTVEKIKLADLVKMDVEVHDGINVHREWLFSDKLQFITTLINTGDTKDMPIIVSDKNLLDGTQVFQVLREYVDGQLTNEVMGKFIPYNQLSKHAKQFVDDILFEITLITASEDDLVSMFKNMNPDSAPVFEMKWGEDIIHFAERAVAFRAEQDSDVAVVFNGLKLLITADKSVPDVVLDFHTEIETAREKYQSSPEYQEYLRKEDEAVEKAWGTIQAHVTALADVDMKNVESAMEWLVKLGGIPVEVPVELRDMILEKYREYGFVPGMNVDEHFKPTDRINVAGFIIGQALSGLQLNRGIHDTVVQVFYPKWLNEFGSQN